MKLDRTSEIEFVTADHGLLRFEERDGNENIIPVFYGNNDSAGRNDSAGVEVSNAAIDTLLNMVKVPIKYFWRVAELDPQLAQNNLNLWLKDATDIGGLVQEGRITQFFDSRRLFLPVSVVRQTVASHLNVDDRLIFDSMDGATYVGTFPIPHSQMELADGSNVHLYIRVQFSDCFEIVPRIDLAVTYDKTFESFYYPVKGRKLRIAGAGASQVVNQITEFIDLVVEQGVKDFIPALDDAINVSQTVCPDSFARQLCTDLRLSRKIGQQLVAGVETTELIAFIKEIGSRLLPEVRQVAIDLETSRAIEIALTSYIVKGSFK